jgi:epoxyqueuosine reductase
MDGLKEKIQAYATSCLGFDLCRFCDPFLGDELNEARDWVTENKLGDMGYLERHLAFKENPNLLLDGVQSAIVVIKNYKNTAQSTLLGDRKVARYAVGQDYHEVISKRLSELVLYLEALRPGVRCYAGVDSRPLAERSLAIKSGIGFRGKNTMVIRPKMGSYFFIGVILTTIRFEWDDRFKGSCGTCQRCIDACPTQALSVDGKLSPTQCISYQTIEQKTPPSPEQRDSFSGWVFGCDICQEVCPFNHENLPLTDWPEWYPDQGVGFHLPESPEIPRNTTLYRSRKRLTGGCG